MRAVPVIEVPVRCVIEEMNMLIIYAKVNPLQFDITKSHSIFPCYSLIVGVLYHLERNFFSIFVKGSICES